MKNTLKALAILGLLTGGTAAFGVTDVRLEMGKEFLGYDVAEKEGYCNYSFVPGGGVSCTYKEGKVITIDMNKVGSRPHCELKMENGSVTISGKECPALNQTLNGNTIIIQVP